MIDTERAAREQHIEQLAPAMREAVEVASGRPVCERKLDFRHAKPAAGRVDGHPHFAAEAGRQREARLARLGRWQPAQRYWHGSEPEWDVVADAIDGKRTLVGEAWYSRKPVTAAGARSAAIAVERRALPPDTVKRDVVRALFVPRLASGVSRTIGTVHLVTLDDVV